MQLLNAKTLLVIAALCALMVGLLTQIERHQQKAEQVQEQREQRAKDFWKQMEKEQKKAPQLGGMEEDLKKHKLF